MSHFSTYHVVQLSVVTSDTALLDSLEGELPDTDADGLGPEYDGPRRSDVPDSDEERLSARVTFSEPSEDTTDGLPMVYDEDTGEISSEETQTAHERAATLVDALTDHDLSDADVDIRHYLSPVGGVTKTQVQDWYRDHPDHRPTDEEGETFIPSSWRPEHHTLTEI